MSIAQAGVFLPFKTLLQGSGMNITETATSITIATTGAGPGGGDMLQSVYATNGVNGVVDKAVVAEGLTTGASVPFATSAGAVPWGGITGAPTSFPSSWSQISGIPTSFPTSWAQITGIPATFPPAPHEATHLPGGTDALPLAGNTSPGLLAQLNGSSAYYVGGDNAVHILPAGIADGDAAAPTTPTAFDDEFTSTTLNPKWSISGTKALVTATLIAPTFLQLAFGYGASGTISLRATELVTTTGGFGFQVKLRFIGTAYSSSTPSTDYMSYAGFGLLAGTRSIGVLIATETLVDAAGNNYYYSFFEIRRGSTMQTAFTDLSTVFTGTDLRLKIVNDGGGANLSIYVSSDGNNWSLIYQEAFSNGGSLNGLYPTSLALDVDSGGSNAGGQGSCMAAFDYVRKIS